MHLYSGKKGKEWRTKYTLVQAYKLHSNMGRITNYNDHDYNIYTEASAHRNVTQSNPVPGLTSVVTHMLPDTSMQNITRESSTPPPCATPSVAWAGAIMNVVSSLVGISSGTMSTSFVVPQNSHSHICAMEYELNP